MAQNPFVRSAALIAGPLLLGLIGGVGGFMLASRHAAPPESTAASDKAIHDYLLAHPEVLPQAMDKLRSRTDAQQLAGVAGKLETPFVGAVLGNPAGRITLVEFSDFACGYCRQSVADVEALIAAHPDLRVVVRQLPIITPRSADAARMGLAAAEQGRYPAFHKAMYAAGGVDEASIAAAATAAGLDSARAAAFIADPRVAAEIDANLGYARELGIEGTPAWVIGRQKIVGAVGRDALEAAITSASKS